MQLRDRLLFAVCGKLRSLSSFMFGISCVIEAGLPSMVY